MKPRPLIPFWLPCPRRRGAGAKDSCSTRQGPFRLLEIPINCSSASRASGRRPGLFPEHVSSAGRCASDANHSERTNRSCLGCWRAHYFYRWKWWGIISVFATPTLLNSHSSEFLKEPWSELRKLHQTKPLRVKEHQSPAVSASVNPLASLPALSSDFSISPLSVNLLLLTTHQTCNGSPLMSTPSIAAVRIQLDGALCCLVPLV